MCVFHIQLFCAFASGIAWGSKRLCKCQRRSKCACNNDARRADGTRGGSAVVPLLAAARKPRTSTVKSKVSLVPSQPVQLLRSAARRRPAHLKLSRADQIVGAAAGRRVWLAGLPASMPAPVLLRCCCQHPAAGVTFLVYPHLHLRFSQRLARCRISLMNPTASNPQADV